MCEGDEDLDQVLAGGGRVLEQVKLRGAAISETLLLESLGNFARAYWALSQGVDPAPRFVFSTNAAPSRHLETSELYRLWHREGPGGELAGLLMCGEGRVSGCERDRDIRNGRTPGCGPGSSADGAFSSGCEPEPGAAGAGAAAAEPS